MHKRFQPTSHRIRKKTSSSLREQYDIIVVGGGSAGCVLANRLSEDSEQSVLLIEAGRSDKHLYSRIPAASPLAIGSPDFNWLYLAEPDPSRNNKTDMWPAGKCIGGGSAINGMMFIRAHPWDFEHWHKLGNEGWAFEDVLPYFKRLEDNERGENEYRGIDGPQGVSEVRCAISITDTWIKAVQQAGFARSSDLNGAEPEGVDYCQLSQKNGLRHSTGHAYLWPILKKRANLELSLETPVQEVITSGGRATGVKVQQGEESVTITAAKGVILSAGAIASPRILMLSGIGPSSELQSHGIQPRLDLPGVGQNLQEHPAIDLDIRVTAPTLSSDRGLFRNMVHGLDFLFRRRGPLTTPIGHAQALVRTEPSLPAPNIQLILTPFSFDRSAEELRISSNRDMGFAVGLMRPRVRGTIQLRSSDPAHHPLIRHQLLGNDEDRRELLDGLRLARKIINQDVFKPFLVKELFPGENISQDEELESLVRDRAFPMYHPVGTCMMGTGKMAVVDNTLKVKGMENLWVVDASIMPTLTSGNTNATVIMIAEKASDLVKAELKKA